jgi:hypothetical protein
MYFALLRKFYYYYYFNSLFLSSVVARDLYPDKRLPDDQAVGADLGSFLRVDGRGPPHLRALRLEKQFRQGADSVFSCYSTEVGLEVSFILFPHRFVRRNKVHIRYNKKLISLKRLWNFRGSRLYMTVRYRYHFPNAIASGTEKSLTHKVKSTEYTEC